MRELRGGPRRRDRATTLPRPASTTDTLSSMSPRDTPSRFKRVAEGSFKPELAEGVSDVHRTTMSSSMSLNSELKSVARGRAPGRGVCRPRLHLGAATPTQVQGGQRESWLSLWRLGQGRPLS